MSCRHPFFVATRSLNAARAFFFDATAIINIYGRNVINADGDVWRFHRRVTGPAFSERIHGLVWSEAAKQASLMFKQWQHSSDSSVVFAPALGTDALKLAMNVITTTAYGTKVGWTRSEDPPCAIETDLSYRDSLEELTAHLFPLFLTPHWLLRLAPRNSPSGRAWQAYTAYGGYMRAMIQRQRDAILNGEPIEENLLTALITAQQEVDPKAPGGPRTMSDAEVMGNLFIFLFAGHETTANTTHYALLSLALNPEWQARVHAEIDEILTAARAEGRDEPDYEDDFPRARVTLAVMYETLRIYTPTGITNKYAEKPQPITYEGQTYVIPAGTRIAVNGTGAHMNPKVWGEDAETWNPSRWLSENAAGRVSLTITSAVPSREPSPGLEERRQWSASKMAAGLVAKDFTTHPITPPPTPPSLSASANLPASRTTSATFAMPASSTISTSTMATTVSWASTCEAGATYSSTGVLKPPKGSWLPFSEGARACSGKKFATVEFVSVLFTLLKDYRVETLGETEGWPETRVRKILAGRKAGALTLQTPEVVPLRFVRR